MFIEMSMISLCSADIPYSPTVPLIRINHVEYDSGRRIARETDLTGCFVDSLNLSYMHAHMWITASHSNVVIKSSTDFDVEQLWYAEL